MSIMEPDEGRRADGPRWERDDAAGRADGPRWERAAADDTDPDNADADSTDS